MSGGTYNGEDSIILNYTNNVESGAILNGEVVGSNVVFVVSSGQVVSNVTIDNEHEIISSGGTGQFQTVSNTGQITVKSGGLLVETNGSSNWIIESGGLVTVESGGTVSGGQTQSGGTYLVSAGGVTKNVSIANGGTYAGDKSAILSGTNKVRSGGVLSGGIVSTYAVISISSGGTAVNNTVASDGGIGVAGVASNTTIQSGGVVEVTSGGVENTAVVQSGGTLDADSNASINNITVNQSGLVIAASDANISGVNTIASGGVISGGIVTKYAAISISSGGTAVNNTVASDGGIGVAGVASNTTIQSGGVVEVTSGGVENTAVVQSGGTLDADSNASINNITVNQSGLVIAASDANISGVNTIASGGVISGGIVTKYAAISISSGGTAVNNTVASDGGIGVAGVASNTTIQSGGVVQVTSGGVADDSTVENGANLYINDGGSVGNTTVDSGGSVTAASDSTISGVITLNDGASATIPATAGGTVVLPGDSNHGLTITGLESGGSVSTVISGWSGAGPDDSDSITLADVSADGVSYAYPSDDQVVLTLADGSTITLNIPGVKDTGFILVDDGHGGSYGEVCFLAGSLIKTPSGTCAIEELVVGDEVMVYANGRETSSLIKWHGKAQCNVRSYLSHDEAGYPVRIVKDAVAPGVPFEDLLVTSEHCLFFENRFIPARMLVNGRSIFYDTSFASYEYFHIETEDHSVIMANGMLTESYLDTGNRHVFRQDTNVITLSPKAKLWEEDAAAVLDVSREFAEPLFHRLNERAGEMGLDFNGHMPALTTDADLHLIAGNNMLIRPARQVGNKVIFMLPACVGEVIIASRSGRPADAVGPYIDDRRNLGVLVGQVTLMEASGTSVIDMHLREGSAGGWSGLEHPACRWTTGRAHLSLCRSNPDTVGLLSVEVISAGPYLLEGDVTQGSLTA
nr:Hint domain-containing protein [Acetobacter thailandicus]